MSILLLKNIRQMCCVNLYFYQEAKKKKKRYKIVKEFNTKLCTIKVVLVCFL
jgi:hypothetical protein